MGGVGSRALVPPLPEPVEADAQQTGQLLPAQPALLLEPLKPPGEIRGKVVLDGPVYSLLHSHALLLSAVPCRVEIDGQGRLVDTDRREDMHPEEDVHPSRDA